MKFDRSKKIISAAARSGKYLSFAAFVLIVLVPSKNRAEMSLLGLGKIFVEPVADAAPPPQNNGFAAIRSGDGFKMRTSHVCITGFDNPIITGNNSTVDADHTQIVRDGPCPQYRPQ
jgi:hypothetical protein